MINRDTFELGQDPERHASTRQRWHKRNLALATFTVLGLLLVVCSCGQSGLSRSKAKTLLEDVKDIQTLASCPALQNNALEKGWIIGVFEKKAPGRYDFLSGPTYTLTKKGQEVFTKTDWWTPPQPEATLTYNPKRYLVANPKKAAGLNFKITGITVPPKSSEGEKIKEVQFSWQYTDLPFVVKRLIVSGGNGKAPFRLYDDGWRVEKDKIELKYSHTPAQLTAQEQERDKAWTHQYKAEASYKKGQYEKAMAEITLATELDPEDTQIKTQRMKILFAVSAYHLRKAESFFKKGAYQSALSEIDVGRKYNPNNSSFDDLQKRIMKTKQILGIK